MKQGSRMLQVCGILLIIGGAISLLMSVLALTGIGLLGAALGSAGAGVVVGLIALFTALAGSVIELVAGILGVKNWRNPEKGKSCIAMSCVILGLQLVSIVSSISSNSFDIWSVVLGLILPVLYLIGAIQLNNMRSVDGYL